MTAQTTSKIWLSSPHMGGEELKFIKEAFDSNWVAPLGPHVDSFEQHICAYTGSAHAAALNSGTSAIHLALILLNVRPGDTVICQSFTFAASANPVSYLGAEPVFIDSEKETWNMDPEALREAVISLTAKGRKPKAIIPVHLYGMPAKMREIMAIAREYSIPVIEDAAEALGSSLNGLSCGSLGDMGILSFNGNKIITTSGGGALLSHNEEWIRQARFLATQARDAAPHYQHSQIGYNYRMSNVVAGIGCGQMMVLDERVAQRRKNFEYYRKALGKQEGISFLQEPEGAFSNRWLTCILVDPAKAGLTREDLRLALESDNIESRPMWKPMHMQPVFRQAAYFGSRVAESLFEDGLCLPSGSNLQEADLERITEIICGRLRRSDLPHTLKKKNRKTIKLSAAKRTVYPRVIPDPVETSVNIDAN